MPEEIKTYPQHRPCSKCGWVASITDFRPAGGLDHGMREYACPHCRYEWYHIPKTPSHAKSEEKGESLM